MAPHPGRVNPYNLGINILREIMRIAADPDEEEREPGAGRARSTRSIRSAPCSRAYDDEGLLREFLTPKVCELSRLYAFEHLEQDPRRIRVSSREADAIREVLVAAALDVRDPARRDRRRRLPRPRRAVARTPPRRRRARRGVRARHAHADRDAVGQAVHGQDVKGRDAGEPRGSPVTRTAAPSSTPPARRERRAYPRAGPLAVPGPSPRRRAPPRTPRSATGGTG